MAKRTPKQVPGQGHAVVRSPYFHKRRFREEKSLSLGHSDQDVLTSCYFSPTASLKRSPSPSPEIGFWGFLDHREGISISDGLTVHSAGMYAEHYALTLSPGFRNFCHAFLASYKHLYMAKPILIQDYVAHDPWKVLVAATLLNKTAGKHAVPAFFSIVDIWPTPQAMSQAPPDELENLIKHLGLGRSRSRRLIALSQVYLSDPPSHARLCPSKCYVNIRVQADDDELSSIVRQRYPPTPISHLPGSGPYALDSYRIFCGADDDWKAVKPHDKELVRYLKWKWAVMELRRWDPLRGPGETLDLNYLHELTARLS